MSTKAGQVHWRFHVLLVSGVLALTFSVLAAITEIAVLQLAAESGGPASSVEAAVFFAAGGGGLLVLAGGTGLALEAKQGST